MSQTKAASAASKTARQTCEWFLNCHNTATGHTLHPTLGKVPTCDRCAKFAGQGKLYSATGAPIWQDLTPFGPMPAEAIALKFSDEVSDAEWITDADRLDALRSEGAPLAYVNRGTQ